MEQTILDEARVESRRVWHHISTEAKHIVDLANAAEENGEGTPEECAAYRDAFAELVGAF
jgi:hypothetical protein